MAIVTGIRDHFPAYSVCNEQAFPNPVAPFWGKQMGTYLGSIGLCDLWHTTDDEYRFGLACRMFIHWGGTVDEALRAAVPRENLTKTEVECIVAAYALRGVI